MCDYKAQRRDVGSQHITKTIYLLDYAFPRAEKPQARGTILSAISKLKKIHFKNPIKHRWQNAQ